MSQRNNMLAIAAILLLFIGCVHSYLGERFILIRLFKQELPVLFGSTVFTKQTLRFAWHLTTVSWFGFAAILLILHFDVSNLTAVLLSIVGVVFTISGALSFGYTKGKHYSYVVFGMVALICFYYAYLGT